MNHKTTLVYIPVNVYEKDAQFNSATEFPLQKLPTVVDKQQFIDQFDYQKLAAVLTANCKNHPSAVGLRPKSAKAIASLHSFHYDVLIVCVKVSPDSLLKESLSEKKLNPKMLNGSSSKQLYLKKDTYFRAENIISVQPMLGYDYANSYKVTGTQIDELWPSGLATIIRPGAFQLSQSNHSLFSAVSAPESIVSQPSVPLTTETFNETKLAKSLMNGFIGF